MKLGVKRNVFIIGVSFFATLFGIYYFINNYYTEYRLNNMINREYLELEENLISNINSQLENIKKMDKNDLFANKDKKFKETSVIYKIDGENFTKIKGDLVVEESLVSKIIRENNKDDGVIINDENIIALSKKNIDGNQYLLIKEVFKLGNDKIVLLKNTNYNLEDFPEYSEQIINLNSMEVKILKHKDLLNHGGLILIEDYLSSENNVILKVDCGFIINKIINNLIFFIMFLYAVVIVIFGTMLFKTINKKFFVKVEGLENKIKGLLQEPENHKEIIKNINADSIDYIEDNINNIISSVNEYKEIVNYYSKYDSLTSLINRETFIKNGDEEIEKGKEIALVYINLDGFSYYNNNFGYVKGDEILRAVSSIILAYNGNYNIVARIGGDEFAILVEEKKDLNNIQSYVEGLLNKINSINLQEKDNFISASIGISTKTEENENTVELINNAYLAMVSVKEKRKNGYEVYTKSHKKEITIGMIQKALKQGNIQVHYQPKVNVKSNEVDGVEALVRWFDEEKGYVNPLEFIKVAEDTGYIITFGEWIFRKAVKDIKALNDDLGKEISVAINVSAIQFMQKNFVDKIEEILREENMNPKNVEIELTESIGIFNSTYVTDTFERLTNLGISIAIDDFGTGYSCIKYLKEFNINTIKIDKSFVQGGGKNISLIKYIIDVSKILGFVVVAEGIEEYRQARILKNLSCDYMQGYFFYKPMPLQKLYEVIKNDETININ